MSWWVCLVKDLEDGTWEALSVESHQEGGIYVVDGSEEADLNVTYNYGQHFRDALNSEDGIKWLHERRAGDCIGRLERAVILLGVYRDKDYWAATPGNAGHALSILLQWARQHPNAYFKVS